VTAGQKHVDIGESSQQALDPAAGLIVRAVRGCRGIVRVRRASRTKRAKPKQLDIPSTGTAASQLIYDRFSIGQESGSGDAVLFGKVLRATLWGRHVVVAAQDLV
jgi:hypothetical protein